MGGILGINELKEQIKSLNDKISKDNDNYEREIKAIKDQYQNDFEKKIKDAILKKEESKSKDEEQNRIDAQKNFESKKEELINNLINQFESEFKVNENNFCKNEIEQIDVGKIDELLNNLTACEDLDSKIKNIIINYTQTYSEENSEKIINHINILLIGSSGVGKTTLINALLNKELPTSNSDPCTKGEPIYYESVGDNNFLRLADSQGIQKSSHGIEAVIDSTKKFVLNQLKTNDPDKFVHCIWYCLNGPRFEDAEILYIKSLANLYGNSKLPVIVVYTRAIEDDLIQGIKDKINKLHLNLGFIDVIAKELKCCGMTLQTKNLDNLKQLSIDKAADAIRSSCYTFLKKKISDYVKNNLQKQKDKIKEHIKKTIHEKIEILTCGNELLNTINIIAEVIMDIIKIYISEENTGAAFTSQGSNYVSEFLVYIFQETMKSFTDALLNIINEKSTNYSQQLISLVLKISKQYNVNIYDDNLEENFKKRLQKDLLDRIEMTAQLFCMKNTAKFITKILNEKIESFIENKYRKNLESEDIDIAFLGEAMKKFVDFDKKLTPQ